VGIIKRQGGKHAILQYLGVGIGAVSTLFIYPLNAELYGFAQFLIATAFLFFPLANLGVYSLSVKFFPKFSDSTESKHAFFNRLLIYSLLVYLPFLILMLVFKGDLISFLKEREFSQIHFWENYYEVLLVMTLLTSLVFLFRQQAINYKRIVVPSVIGDLSLKFFLPLGVIASVYWGLTLEGYSYWYLGYLMAVILFLIIYLYNLGALSLVHIPDLFKETLTWKEIRSYSLFNSLTKMGSVLAFKIDAFMITLMLGASSNGIYYIFLFIANVIQIPFKSINQISAPLISSAWEADDMSKLEEIYKKAAINLAIIAFSMFLFLWFSLPDIIDLQILAYSRHYRYSVVFVLIMGVLNVILNYYLIGEMGLLGAAVASLIAYGIYNVSKMTFLYVVYGLNPWDQSMVFLLGLSVIGFFMLYLASSLDIGIVRLPAYAVIILLVIILPTVRLRLSLDFNQLLSQLSGRLPIFGQSMKSAIDKYC
jgi:O-antigen/teichoic acid export membrane protein